MSVGRAKSVELKAAFFKLVIEERVSGEYGSVQRALFRLRRRGFSLTYRGATRFVSQWKAQNWVFNAAEKKGRGRKRKLSEVGETMIVNALKNSTIRAVSRNNRFATRTGGFAKVSRCCIQAVRKRKGLVVCAPKKRRIRHHVAHHKRMREVHCQTLLKAPPAKRRRIWYADEQGWPITLSPNSKNCVVYTTPEKCAETNVHRMTKGDEAICFSLFWVISETGVVYFKLFEGTMDVAQFHKFLKKVAPKVAARKRTTTACSWFYHDHVTNSSSLFDKEKMDACFGEGKWLQHSQPICRQFNGEYIDVAQSKDGKRRAHQRKKMEAKAVCDCEVKSGEIVPSSSPDLNIAELAQGYLRQLVSEHLATHKKRWSGSVASKMLIVKNVILELDANKGYWQKLFSSNTKRLEKCIELKGGLLKS